MLLRRQFIQTSAIGLLSLGTALPVLANTGSRWVKVAGKATDISIGANGQVWILGDKRSDGGLELFRRDGNTWTKVPGGGVKLAVDPKGLPWVINTEGLIFQFLEQGGWTRQGRDGADIAIGADGSVFCLTKSGADQNGGVFKWGLGQWSPVEGRGTSIAVDPKGQVWVLTQRNELSRLEAGAWKRVAGTQNDLAIGANGTVWAVGTDSEKGGNSGVHILGKSDTWTKVPGAAVRVAVDPKGLPWVVSASGEIFQRV